MKIMLSSCVAFMLLLGVSSLTSNDAQAQNVYFSNVESVSISPEVAEVKGLIDQFGRMWETQDLEMFSKLVANDPNIVVIGTDRAEFMIGFDDYLDARKRQFEAFTNIEYDVTEQTVRISEHGQVAWFTKIYDMFLLDASDQPLSFEGIRVSGVLEQQEDGWKIVHLHTSLPVEGQAAEY